jgi:hypothetical protein
MKLNLPIAPIAWLFVYMIDGVNEKYYLYISAIGDVMES